MNPDELVAHAQAAIDRMNLGDLTTVEILGHLARAAEYRALALEQRGRGVHALAARLEARAETFLSNARLLAQPRSRVDPGVDPGALTAQAPDRLTQKAMSHADLGGPLSYAVL